MKYSELYKYRGLIVKGAKYLSDEEALEAPALYDKWEVGVEYKVEEENGVLIKPRVLYNDVLYRVKQTHTSHADWTPDIAVSLYEEVPKPGQGDSPDNPIPYNGNMALEKDKYYSEDGIIYICFRDTEIPVHNRLADLVLIYVNVYQLVEQE